MSAVDTQAPPPHQASRPRPRYRSGRQRPAKTDSQRAEATSGTSISESAHVGSSGASHGAPAGAAGAGSTAPTPVVGTSNDGQRTERGRRRPRPSHAQGMSRRPNPGIEATTNASGNESNRLPPPRGGQPFGRQFGGHLTSTATEATTSGAGASTLDAAAAEFRPGQTPSGLLQASDGNDSGAAKKYKSARPPRQRRHSKSSAPDVVTRIHEDITNNVYECPICTSEIGPRARIWSCQTCWTVFHLGCVKRWSRNGDSGSRSDSANESTPPARTWRCPGCNLPKDVMPSNYACWCGKEEDPPALPGLPPHSCGQTCAKARVAPKKCPHPCELLCHAGPCPPCTRMGPAEPCFCGKEVSSKKCIDTDYDNGWSCGKICGDLMPCAQHACQRTCHDGLCGRCEVEIQARCYCGKVDRLVSCYERGPERQSELLMSKDANGTIETWAGSFDCGDVCGRSFDCGKHRCQRRCHTLNVEPGHCPRSPDIVTHCPCGKTPVVAIWDKPRQSCEDPIPNCREKCLKRLGCGHECQQICHVGECMPCLESVSIACRCGRTQSRSICHQGSTEPPQCRRLCKTTLSCGRHECAERCCPGERKATERQSVKRKQRPLDAAPQPTEPGFEAEHICTRTCGRKLKCGNHSCTQLCHKGACGSCREAIFDELPCHCGRTVLQPPLPCGTRPPACNFDCDRPRSCGHPQVAHNCHGDEESCPKCPFLTEKVCMCRKKTVKNQQCWRTDIGCGETCGKLLRCGAHRCRKSCHRPGECEDNDKHCQQACGKPKKACGHACDDPCHAPYACSEDKPCQHKILVTCSCQHLKKEMRCSAHKGGAGNQLESLTCDEECGRLERNRKLALALNIDPETHQDDHVPYSKATMAYYASNANWAQTQERAFRIFAADENEKRLRFKPMPAQQRGFLHSLAEDFGFDSESLDPEPHRHILVLKTPRFVMAPMKRLSQCVDIRTHNPKSGSGLGNAGDAHTRSEAASGTGTGSRELPFNGLLLCQPRFALTIEEVRSQLDSLLNSNPKIAFSVDFLPSEEVLLRAHSRHGASQLSDKDIENSLRTLHAPLTRSITASSKQLAKSIMYCRVDPSLNIIRRDTGLSNTTSSRGGEGGWSKVAAKAAVPARTVPPERAMGEKSVFTVLGSKARQENGASASASSSKKKKEKKPELEVVDDWEQAETEAELREKQEQEMKATEDEARLVQVEGAVVGS